MQNSTTGVRTRAPRTVMEPSLTGRTFQSKRRLLAVVDPARAVSLSIFAAAVLGGVAKHAYSQVVGVNGAAGVAPPGNPNGGDGQSVNSSAGAIGGNGGDGWGNVGNGGNGGDAIALGLTGSVIAAGGDAGYPGPGNPGGIFFGMGTYCGYQGGSGTATGENATATGGAGIIGGFASASASSPTVATATATGGPSAWPGTTAGVSGFAIATAYGPIATANASGGGPRPGNNALGLSAFGVDGGTATATAGLSTNATAIAQGGAGGYSTAQIPSPVPRNYTGPGGNGGLASGGATASAMGATGIDVSATVTMIGGAGGSVMADGPAGTAGAGMNETLFNYAGGNSASGTLTLSQTATGGNAGNATSVRGIIPIQANYQNVNAGTAGVGNSSLLYQSVLGETSLKGKAFGNGGTGGSTFGTALPTPGANGSASSTMLMGSGAGDVEADATATGGNGGNADQAIGSEGGLANASASAVAFSGNATANANASAGSGGNSISGFGGNGAAATAVAYAYSATGTATATAIAAGGYGGTTQSNPLGNGSTNGSSHGVAIANVGGTLWNVSSNSYTPSVPANVTATATRNVTSPRSASAMVVGIGSDGSFLASSLSVSSTLQIDNNLTINPGSTLTISGGTLQIGSANSGTASPTITNAGTVYAYSGSVTTGTLPAGNPGVIAMNVGTIYVSNALIFPSSTNVTLYNAGTITDVYSGSATATFPTIVGGGSFNGSSYNTGTFNISSGIYSFTGGFTVANSGTLIKTGTGQLAIANDLNLGTGSGGTAGMNVTAGTVSLGTHALVVGASGGSGTVNLTGGYLTAGSISLNAGVINQSGGTVTVSGAVTVGGQYNLSGGTENFTSETISSGGLVTWSGGTVYGNIYNYGTARIYGASGLTIHGNAVNEAGGYIKTYGGTVGITGTFSNYGTFVSDPADNHFGSIILVPAGALEGGSGDRFFVTYDLLSTSDNNTGWDTQKSQLIFTGGNAHQLTVNGRDEGATYNGYDNNFAWGELTLGQGDSLTLEDGNLSAGAALYVGEINFADGLSAGLAEINSNGLNIYYDSGMNPSLAGQSFALAGGGTLSAVPEPSSVALLVLLCSSNLSRRRAKRSGGKAAT